MVVEEGSAGAELLTTDPAVDMVSFTGSTVIGKQILAQAASTVKRVALELGGKSAQIYLPDALDRVGVGAMEVVAMTAGQACVAATRMLVPEEAKGQVLDAVSGRVLDDQGRSPYEPTSLMGPVISGGTRDRCERYVALAEEHGAQGPVFGGSRPAGLDRGYYFEPTVLDLAEQRQPGGAGGDLRTRALGDRLPATSTTRCGSPTTASTGCPGRSTEPTWPLRRPSPAACELVPSTSTPQCSARTHAGGGYKQSGLGSRARPRGHPRPSRRSSTWRSASSPADQATDECRTTERAQIKHRIGEPHD